MATIDCENGEIHLTTKEQLILDLDEKNEELKKCIENIKDLIKSKVETIEEYKEIFKEIKEEIDYVQNRKK